jgi:hypothetical protein
MKMNKQWISQLAGDVEAKYGKKQRDRIFGDIEGVHDTPESLSAWFRNFTIGMDELNDKKFLQQMMANRCPCGGDDEENGKAMKEFYDNSKTLDEFIDLFGKWLHKKYNGDVDKMELRGNVLNMIKPSGGHKVTGSCGNGCHCFLARFTEKIVSDIFCHCCTIGHTGRMFKVAFGDDIKMEFIESIICGGKECVMAVHLPKMNKSLQ